MRTGSTFVRVCHVKSNFSRVLPLSFARNALRRASEQAFALTMMSFFAESTTRREWQPRAVLFAAAIEAILSSGEMRYTAKVMGRVATKMALSFKAQKSSSSMPAPTAVMQTRSELHLGNTRLPETVSDEPKPTTIEVGGSKGADRVALTQAFGRN